LGKSVLLFSLKDLTGLPFLFEKCRTGPFEIHAFEFFSERCLAAVGEKLKRKSPLQNAGPYYALTEVTGNEKRDAWLESVLASPLVLDAFQAESSSERKMVWGLREGITESLALTAPLRKHDFCVPIGQAAAFLAEVEAKAREMKAKVDLYLFGHFGD